MSSNYFEINRIIPFSNLDGPGNRFAVFLQECNLNCHYCHNPETINRCNSCGECVSVCPTKALSFIDMTVSYNERKCIKCDACLSVCPNSSSPKVKKATVDELFNDISRRADFLSGVSFSGGESSLQHKAITELFDRMKERIPKLTRLIDTNGNLDFESLSSFVNSTDLFILDVKAFNEEEHIKLTGKSNRIILKNLKFLMETGKLCEVRTVICPDVFNCEETVMEISKLLKSSDVNYKLTPFRPQGVRKEFLKIKTPSDSYMQKLEVIKDKCL